VTAVGGYSRIIFGGFMADTFFDFSAKAGDGSTVPLDEYKGKVVLVVNVASQCGYTPQYKGLESLYRKFKDKGLVILGFPCNQFGSQEPGTDEEIHSFCEMNYGVTFPVMSKIDVNGKNADPIYDFLKSHAPGILGTEMIKWNFTKFLVDKNGHVVERFAPKVEPEEIAPTIEKLL
jgi:glutathione peroxidase